MTKPHTRPARLARRLVIEATYRFDSLATVPLRAPCEGGIYGRPGRVPEDETEQSHNRGLSPGLLLSRCCHHRGSAAAARSRATAPATTRAEPAAILGLRRRTARGTRTA